MPIIFMLSLLRLRTADDIFVRRAPEQCYP